MLFLTLDECDFFATTILIIFDVNGKDANMESLV